MILYRIPVMYRKTSVHNLRVDGAINLFCFDFQKHAIHVVPQLLQPECAPRIRIAL